MLLHRDRKNGDGVWGVKRFFGGLSGLTKSLDRLVCQCAQYMENAERVRCLEIYANVFDLLEGGNKYENRKKLYKMKEISVTTAREWIGIEKKVKQ